VRSARAGLLALALGAVAAGCRSLPVATPLPGDDARPEACLAALVAAASARVSLRGVARVALSGPDGESRSRQILVVARPARLRVEVQGLLGQLVAVLVSDGARFALFRAGEDALEEGEIRPALLYEVAGLPLRPEEAVDALLGVPELGAPTRLGPAAALSNGFVRLDLLDAAGGASRRLECDAETRLRRLEVRAPDGALAWQARYDDHRPVAGTSFPHEIELDFPAAEARAKVAFQWLELNPELPPGIFTL
jgi:hypothetical protein